MLLVLLALLSLVSAMLGNRWLPDYSVLWTGARIAFSQPERLYDFDFVTNAQSWLVEPEHGPRPWVYPPTALLVLAPFAWLPFFWSYCAFMIVSGAAYLFASTRFFCRQWIPGLTYLLLSYSVFFAARSGQTTFLIGAGTVGALLLLRSQPVWAGVLFGLAAAVKPQMLVLAPLAMIAGGYWSALGASFVAGAGAVGLSLLLFGLQPWLDWISSLPAFVETVRGMDILDRGVTPTAMLWNAGFDGPVVSLLRIAFAVFAAIVVWRTFRNTESLTYRLVALVGGALLCIPYAMNYELVMLMPAAVFLLLGAGRESAWAESIAAAGLVIASGAGAPFIAMIFLLIVFYYTPSGSTVSSVPRPSAGFEADLRTRDRALSFLNRLTRRQPSAS